MVSETHPAPPEGQTKTDAHARRKLDAEIHRHLFGVEFIERPDGSWWTPDLAALVEVPLYTSSYHGMGRVMEACARRLWSVRVEWCRHAQGWIADVDRPELYTGEVDGEDAAHAVGLAVLAALEVVPPHAEVRHG